MGFFGRKKFNAKIIAQAAEAEKIKADTIDRIEKASITTQKLKTEMQRRENDVALNMFFATGGERRIE